MAETGQEDECKFGGPKFDPPVYKQRYSAVVELAQKSQAKKVVDMGCAECKLLRLLRRKQFIEELVGVDIDSTLLQLSENVVQPLITDFLVLRPNPFVMRLMQGSIADPDQRLLNFDLLACIEVIEHLDPPVLEKVPESIFGVLRPKMVAITTPNAEFNVLFPGFSGFRHADHRFEWTRKEFELWCFKVCERYPYSVEFSGVGEPPAGMEHVGCCSQMAVFTRLNAPSDTPEDVIIDAEAIGMPYNVIAECIHPHEKHPLSPKEKLCQEVEYYLNVLLRQKLEVENVDCPINGDSCVITKPPSLGQISECSSKFVNQSTKDYTCGTQPSLGPISECSSNQSTKDYTCGTQPLHLSDADTMILVGLEELLRFPRIKTLCNTVDEIRSALQLSTTVKLDTTGQYAAFDHPESGTESDSSSETDHDNQPVVYADDGTTGQLVSLQMGTSFSLKPEECWD